MTHPSARIAALKEALPGRSQSEYERAVCCAPGIVQALLEELNAQTFAARTLGKELAEVRAELKAAQAANLAACQEKTLAEGCQQKG